MPLALTSLLALASQPTVTFFMGQSRGALESLAVLPVVHGLTFIFRSLGLSYLEVVIALLGPTRQHFAMIRNFAVGLGLVAAVSLISIAFTPLAFVWFREGSGLSDELAQFAIMPARILAVVPQESSFGFPFSAQEIVLMGRHPHLAGLAFECDGVASLPAAAEHPLIRATSAFVMSSRRSARLCQPPW